MPYRPLRFRYSQLRYFFLAIWVFTMYYRRV